MLYSSTFGYAIRALTDLAGEGGGEFRLGRNIARAQDIPGPFLGKILHALVRAGLLQSSKGPHGGYRLARRAEAITLLTIKEAIEGTADLEGCASGLGRCSDDMPCPQHERFKPVRVALKQYLATTTVADMAQALAEKRALLGNSESRPSGRGRGSSPRG